MKGLFSQFIKFGFVGGVCFLFEYLLLALFKEVFGIYYLIAAALAFLSSTVLNYILSMRFVFRAKEDSTKPRLFIIYVLLSITGLGINTFLVWLGVDVLGINLYITKLFATLVVLIYNFITRKIFIEEK